MKFPCLFFFFRFPEIRGDPGVANKGESRSKPRMSPGRSHRGSLPAVGEGGDVRDGI